MHHPTDRIVHTTVFVTPVVEHWLDREIPQWVHHEGSIRRPIQDGELKCERVTWPDWNLHRRTPDGLLVGVSVRTKQSERGISANGDEIAAGRRHCISLLGVVVNNHLAIYHL